MKSTLGNKTAPNNGKVGVERERVFWVMSTHWDREWYESFQGFRYRLVRLLDEVLDLLEDDANFTHFQMDGQSIPIEDYLEIRPERAEQVRRFATSGRLAIGPWYVLPDEFIVGGESLIRNLSEGLRVARSFGTPSLAGFACDIFGHNSQLPQIFQGFGINSAYIWRGTNEKGLGSHFRWASPEGSEVLAFRFGPSVGYCDFAFKVRMSNESEKTMPFEAMEKAIGDYIASQTGRNSANMPILMFDGGDHLEIEPSTGKIIKDLKASPLGQRYDLQLGTLDDVEKAQASVDQSGLPLIVGELRAPAIETKPEGDQQWLIPGVLSSRIPIKQANEYCETLLTAWAEPLSLFASHSGMDYPHGFLRAAWRHLLANHAHDSICGCSIDQVHKDMEYRFDQARMIAERLRRAAMEHLIQHVALPAPAEGDSQQQILLLANPTAQAIHEPVDITVTLPENTPAFSEFFGFEGKPGFWLNDVAGKRVAYQRVAQNPSKMAFNRQLRKFPTTGRVHEIEVTATVEIPAFGYTTLTIEPAKGPTRHAERGLRTGVRSAENSMLKLEITAGGLINLTDKRTMQVYNGLMELEDRADIGDGWYHGQAVNDQTFFSGAVAASVGCIADGPERTDFQIELDWSLPERFEFDTMRRSPQRSPLRIVHHVTLRANSARLEVRTTVHNTHRDHRLRVLFPTSVHTDTYWADSAFDAVERPIALNADHIQWRELEVETKPQRSWTAVSDVQRGLAIISKGLPESAVLDNPDRAIALTLYRSFKKAVFTDGQPNGQLLQDLSFDYWIVPLADAIDPVHLANLGLRMSAGVSQQQADFKLLRGLPAQQQTLPRTQSFLQCVGNGVVSSVRAAQQGGMLVRIFNPNQKQSEISLQVPQGIAKAWVCNLDDQPGESITPHDGALRLSVASRRIVTLLIQ